MAHPRRRKAISRTSSTDEEPKPHHFSTDEVFAELDSASLVEKQLDRLRFPRFVVPNVEAVIAWQENNRVAFLILCDDDGVLRESVGLGAPRFGFLDHVIRRARETAAVRIVVHRVEEPVSLVGIVDFAAVLRHQTLPQVVREGAAQCFLSSADS